MLLLWSLLSGVVFILLAAWLRFRVANRHVLALSRVIPSVQPCYPILGNSLIFSRSLELMTERGLCIVKENVLKGHRAMCFWIGPLPLVCVINPDDIRKILNNSLSRGKQMEECSADYLKHGLLTAPVEHWKMTRRHLNMSFHLRNLEQLMPTFNSTSRQLVADLFRHVDGDVFDLMPHVMSTALRNIGTFLYGQKTMELLSTDEFNSLTHAVEMVGEIMALRVLKPWLLNGFLFKLVYWKEFNSIKAATQRVLEIANNSSAEELLKGEDVVVTDGKFRKSYQYGFNTILNAMRELQKNLLTLTDQHVMEEIVSFFATGTDTMGVAISSCLLALAQFPDIQNKVYEEVSSVLSTENETDVTLEELKRLPYLDKVIKETLRFFIVVPFTTRSPDKDIDLDGYTIPANWLTGICISAVCLDPKYFPEPHKFDPERFSTPNSFESIFIPFSRGPRNCIGKEYSMMLMKVIIVHVVRRYILTTDMDIQNLKRKFMVTLVSCDGYNVRLCERNNN